MTTIVTEDTGDQGATDDGGAAFAAGVASATAATAAADADDALERAEQAEQIAESAVSTASAAMGETWDVRAEVDGLRDEMRSGFATIGEALAGLATPAAADDTAPAPEARQTAAQPAAEGDAAEVGSKKAKGKHFWWGDRA